MAKQHDAPRAERDAKHEEALKDGFPASDPPSTTPPPGTRRAEQTAQHGEREGSAEPTGLPTSDRHASETALATDSHPEVAHTKTR
jgi:hypothetical protein